MTVTVESRRIRAGEYLVFFFDLEHQITMTEIGIIKRVGSKLWGIKASGYPQFTASTKTRCEKWLKAKLESQIISLPVAQDDIPGTIMCQKDAALYEQGEMLTAKVEVVEAEIINPTPIPSKDPQIKPGSHVEIWGKKAIVLATLRLKPSNKPSHVKVKYTDSGRTAQPLIENCTLID